MAIIVVDIGNTANDGTGDPIRTAFDHVNDNFTLLDGQLNNWGNLRADSFSIHNLEADGNISANTGTIYSNVFESNAAVIAEVYATNIAATSIGTITTLNSDTITVDNITVNADADISGNLVVTGTTDFNSNVTVTGSITPTANLTYDLGSPSAFFKNLYTEGLVQVNTVTLEADASLLLLQANLIPGNEKDVGILGKYYNGSGNTYAYFGFQKATEDFVYIKTDTDASAGNSIVASGTYGNVHFGSQFLSNTTAATNTTTGALIVAGGAGIAGNTHSTTFVGNVSSTLANITNLTVSNRVDGNLTVQGTIFSNSKRVMTEDYVTGNVYQGGNIGVAQTNFIYDGVLSNSTSSTTGAVVIVRGLGVGGNVNVGGNVVASTGLVGPYYGTIQTANQPNITGLGTLGSLTVTNNIVAGGQLSGALVSGTAGSFTANVDAGNFNAVAGIVRAATGNFTTLNTGSLIVNSINNTPIGNATPSTGAFTTLSASGNITAGNLTTTNIVGTLQTASQPNITALGTLSSLTVTGNITSSTGNIVTSGTVINSGIVTTGNVTASRFNGSGAGLTSIPNSALTNSSVTVNGTAISLGGSGTVTAAAGTLTGATLASGVTASSLTSVGTLTGLTVSGAILPSANASIDLGSTSSWFGTVYGLSTQAKYADLAENYLADAEYAPGTVVMFGGSEEITLATLATTAVAGIVSTNPAYLMNADLSGKHVTPVAFTGRVPCRVTGPVRKGDVMVAGNNGTAVSIKTIPSTYNLELGSVIGKALGTNEGGDAVIEVVVGRF